MNVMKLKSARRGARVTQLACVSVLAIACASAQRQPAQSAPPPAPATPQEVKAPPADAGLRKPDAPITPELERLARSVRGLDDPARDPEHHRVLRALRDASDALEQLEPERAGNNAPLRAAIERIEASGRDSLSHSDELRAALAGARVRLQAYDAGAERAAAFDAALIELDPKIDALNPGRPLLEQQPAVSISFRALTNALFLAAGHDAPFTDGASEPRSLAEVLEHARADVLTLGRADLSNIRQRTSRAMESMAELVEAIEGLAARGTVSPRIQEIRAEVQRLEHDSRGPFALTGWVEQGLVAALRALDELEVCREALVTSSTDAARSAARGLPERGALPFQHAAMQDAFRATLDAFSMVLLDREACQDPSRRSEPATLSATEPASLR